MLISPVVLAADSGAPHELCDSQFFFHQMLGGVAVAVPERATSPKQRRVFEMAKGMQNFMYLVGDAQAGRCIAVDAVYDPEGVVSTAEKLGCNVTAFVATHFHYDHIGHNGRTYGGPGLHVPGMHHFVSELGLPGYIHETELSVAAQQTSVSAHALTPLRGGDELTIGEVTLQVLHTPGHSPGGMTLLASVGGQQRLALTGDTVFPGSCGRLDLPGSSVDAMFTSLQRTLAALADELPLFPGDAYSGASSTVGAERRAGLLRPMRIEQWRRMMSR